MDTGDHELHLHGPRRRQSQAVQPPVQHGDERQFAKRCIDHDPRHGCDSAIPFRSSRHPSPSTGVGPGLVLAIDNTLGPDSPYQGRIYAAYVVYFNDHRPESARQSDHQHRYRPELLRQRRPELESTRAWSMTTTRPPTATRGRASTPLSAYTSGRTQFQPAIAVDQATGTLVISWRDARNDAANARVATYITTSIDGGKTFSAQTYANPSQTAVDAITGQTDVLGPEADNQSGGDGAQADVRIRLRQPDGAGRLRWSGLSRSGPATSTQRYLINGTTVTADPLNIWYRPMVIAAGPRIINSTMGPIPLAEAASGSVSISVTFDRPINPATFVPGDVQVFYHDTTNGDPSIPLTVTGVTPPRPASPAR